MSTEQEDTTLTAMDYANAIDVQSACNLCGVVQSFAKIMLKIRANAKGTDEANMHPIARMYAEQIGHLTGAGMGDNETYHTAYMECYRRMEELNPKA